VSVDTTLWAGVLVAVSTALLAYYILLKTNPRLKKWHEEPAAT
jgi:H+/gluconate symporter-like permease